MKQNNLLKIDMKTAMEIKCKHKYIKDQIIEENEYGGTIGEEIKILILYCSNCGNVKKQEISHIFI